ncbi:hypothetical protein J3P75_00940 [Pseudomonas sp. R1-1]|uniref:hypothetical protein n=1 Tax=Pseudomonas sp. R1-1 TaxID=1602529 RepID=UPI003DA96873
MSKYPKNVVCPLFSLIVNPDRVKDEPFTYIDTAGWFWAKNKLLVIADSNDIAQMTRRIGAMAPMLEQMLNTLGRLLQIFQPEKH